MVSAVAGVYASAYTVEAVAYREKMAVAGETDIDWAFHAGHLYLLQCRAITSQSEAARVLLRLKAIKVTA